MKITQDIINELLDEDTLTKKREREILASIDDKVQHIWHFIATKLNTVVYSWAYSTDDSYYDNGGNGSDGGYFCPHEYSEWIEIIGHNGISNKSDYFASGFDTSLLFVDDWQEWIVSRIAEEKKEKELAKQKSKEKREETKRKKKEIQEEIKAILTKEQLKYIKFK
jgi:hypothetical protein